jgi:Flp pilus assembly protein CpaB
MNRRRIGVLLIGGGLILAVIVAAVVWLAISDAERLRQDQPKRMVAVAKVDIPERSTIDETQLDIVKLPDQAIPPGSASATIEGRSEEQARTDIMQQMFAPDASGKPRSTFTPVRIFKGEVINKERLGSDALKNTPSFEIPPGKVAYPFPVRVSGGSPTNERILVGFLNAVRPGDFIDVYYSSVELPTGLTQQEEERLRQNYPANYLYTRRLMQNIKVMNVGFFPDAKGTAAETPRDERFLTLEVTPDQALLLKWIKDAASFTGNLEFVLRSPVDTQPFPQQTVDFQSVSTQFGIGTGR